MELSYIINIIGMWLLFAVIIWELYDLYVLIKKEETEQDEQEVYRRFL